MKMESPKHIVEQLRIYIMMQNEETSAILKRVLEMKLSNNFRKKIEKHLKKIQ